MSISPLPPLFTTSPLVRPSPSARPSVTTTPSLFTFASPLSTHGSHTPSPPSKSRGSPSSPPLTSGYFETLSFAKIPVRPTPSTTVSTDSEAGCISSDWGAGCDQPRSGAQSPSLISTLFQSQSQPARSRQTSSNCSGTTSPNPTIATPTCKNVSKPILRRDTAASTSASEDCREHVFGLGISKASDMLPASSSRNGVTAASTGLIKKRPSVLTFAVNPCLPSPRTAPSSRPRSRSTSVSPMSSYRRSSGRASPPPLRMPTWGATHAEEGCEEVEDEEDDEDDAEDDVDDREEFVDSPLPIPGHESDSDDGYREDEEDGFTSEEDIDGVVDTTFPSAAASLKHRPSWASTAWATQAVNALTPRRRTHTIDAYTTSTDDYEQPYNAAAVAGPSTSSAVSTSRGRKTSICITAAAKPSSSRCTRHRSPPPPVRLSVEPAPPAARSPSAAELCRRRGSLADNVESVTFSRQGWKSDDSAFFHSFVASGSGTNRRPSAPSCDSTFVLPSALGGTTTSSDAAARPPPRKGSLPTPSLSSGKSQYRSILRRKSTTMTKSTAATSIPMQRSSGAGGGGGCGGGGGNAKPTAPTMMTDLPTQIKVLRGGSVPTISVDTRARAGGVVAAGGGGGLARSACDEGENGAKEGLKRVLERREIRVM
ncbi:hypothetical protein CI109_104365 [Kwoniella shandongensis]|uniref:Uncharacterized protein n=1 Tax=Kwoniella shandongensis TaxID=1734106 RepID=A0A5M6BYF4_9TREE|nr:uncharacterized protein CI109_004237 [Kwoniella shandongensis]KAA5527421.1 hypothetical protein CI109_004237 [Kwoniella shandongensis]